MKIDAKNVKPEVVAAIAAAVQMMMGQKVVAVRIKSSSTWARAGRYSIL
jgi:methylmalonyl-CoA carboxyltransferase 12S subunit